MNVALIGAGLLK